MFLPKSELQALIDVLHEQGRTVVGPTIDQQAIVYSTIESTDDLPKGWTDDQQPGTYRLKPSGNERYFGYVVGPHSWKQFLFPPTVTVATSERTDDGWQMQSASRDVPQYAFLGVRACSVLF